jgi:hypothetical protein
MNRLFVVRGFCFFCSDGEVQEQVDRHARQAGDSLPIHTQPVTGLPLFSCII